MKIRSIVSYTSTVAALAGMPFLVQRVQARPIPMSAQIPTVQFGNQQEQPQEQSSWNDDQKRELRHIYYRLEHASGDYEGHRSNALHEIRRAADEMGMDLHGSGYTMQSEGSQGYGEYGQQPERQELSGDALQRTHDRLRDLANSAEDPVRQHLFNAAHELNMAARAHDND